MTDVLPYFEITQEALDFLVEQRQLDGDEKAGVLVGSEFGDNAYRINKASYPCMCNDSSSRCGCIRDAKLANDFIQQEYELSNKTRFYLGEWHTHPEDFPAPSIVDFRSMKEIIKTGNLPANTLLLIIVGLKGVYYACYINGRFHEVNPKVV